MFVANSVCLLFLPTPRLSHTPSRPTLSKIYTDLNNLGGVICGPKSLSSCPFVRPLSPFLSIYLRLSAPFCLSFTFCVRLSLLSLSLSLFLSHRDSLALYFNARPIVLSPLVTPHLRPPLNNSPWL